MTERGENIHRAPMNIPMDWEAVWTAVAITMIRAPMKTVGRRPIPSDKYGAKGYPARPPIFCLYKSVWKYYMPK